jgi:ribose 5-phosphate isomerase B
MSPRPGTSSSSWDAARRGRTSATGSAPRAPTAGPTGVRAALCTDPETARGARKWNDANVLAMGLRLTSEPVAVEIVDAFLATDPDGTETANIAAVEPT